MKNILIPIFGNRISFNNTETLIQNYAPTKQEFFNKYIELKHTVIPNTILLDAFDIFDSIYYLYIVNNFDNNEFIKLEKNYINYYYQKNIKNINNKQLEQQYRQCKERYTQLYITDKYLKLLKIRPVIQLYFDKFITNNSTKMIILIERKYSIISSKKLRENTSGQRRIIFNHKKLKNRLKAKYGKQFKNVILDNLNIFEQYNLFKNAKIIIGQHGAGLCNIFFCNNKINPTLIEICPVWNNGNYWFENLASFCNINYISIKQNIMSKKQWQSFSSKKIIELDVDVDDSIFEDNINPINSLLKNIKEIKLYENIKLQENIKNPIITFIRNSGSVDIKQIMNTIDSII